MGLKQKIEAKEFVILAEMEPPKGADVSRMVNNAQKVKGMVDAFVVPEMSNAVMRMSSLGGAMILKSKGLETVMQLNCRDRNRLALQADLLAANGCGISSVMVVKGDDPGLGDHHQARGVYDIDLPELLAAIDGLQQGRDMAGIELSGAPEFLVGSTVEAGARDKSPELILDEMNGLIQGGTRFFITSPLFDMAAIEPVWKKVDRETTTVIPTVLLLVVIAGAVMVWGLMGFYQIDQQERGVVLRFGKYLETVQPGLQWNPPLIDSVTKVNTTKVRAASLREIMLTQDENIVEVNLSVQYVIDDRLDLCFEFSLAGSTLGSVEPFVQSGLPAFAPRCR